MNLMNKYNHDADATTLRYNITLQQVPKEVKYAVLSLL